MGIAIGIISCCAAELRLMALPRSFMPTTAGMLACRAGWSIACVADARKVSATTPTIVAPPKGVVSISSATKPLRTSEVDSQPSSTSRRSKRSAMAPPMRLKSSVATPRAPISTPV